MFISYRANIGFIASQLWVRVSWTDHLFITTGDRRAMSSLQVGTVFFPHRVGEYWAATGNARFQSHTESRNWILLIEFSHSMSIRSRSLFWFLGSHHFEALLEFLHMLLAHAEPSTEYWVLIAVHQPKLFTGGRMAARKARAMSSPRITCLHVCYTQYEFVIPKLHRKASKSAATACSSFFKLFEASNHPEGVSFSSFFPSGWFEFDSMRFHPPGSPFGAPTTGTRNVWGNWGHESGQRMVDIDDVRQEISDIGGLSYSFRDSFDIKFCFPFWKASTGQEASLQPDHPVLLSCTRCAKTRLNYTCGVTIVTSSQFSHLFMICNGKDEIQHSICFHGCCTKWFHCGLFVVWGGDGRQEEGNGSPTPRGLQRGHDVASEKLVRDGILKITELHQKFRSWAKMLNLEALMWTVVVCETWKAEHEHDP